MEREAELKEKQEDLDVWENGLDAGDVLSADEMGSRFRENVNSNAKKHRLRKDVHTTDHAYTINVADRSLHRDCKKLLRKRNV